MLSRRRQKLVQEFTLKFIADENHLKGWANLALNNKITIAVAGAITVILKIMTAHVDHAGVNQFGCSALANRLIE